MLKRFPKFRAFWIIREIELPVVEPKRPKKFPNLIEMMTRLKI